ncbi:MAG: DUF1566 domain-containing protein [Myxococcaceae bacterium]|nr:DUF1566 domain-containing protein [Myxococcaceae bacterium]
MFQLGWIFCFSFGALAQFSISTDFGDHFHGYFQNLSTRSQDQTAVRAILNRTADQVKSSLGYRMPFELNCSVFFDVEVERVDCWSGFEPASALSSDCELFPELAMADRLTLRRYHLLQVRMVVGWSQAQMLQAHYRIVPKSTLTASLSESENMGAKTLTVSQQVPKQDFETTLTSSPEASVSHTLACSVSTAQLLNGLLAAWNHSTGVYSDAVDQTGRYAISNGVVSDALTSMQWEQVAGTTPMVFASVASYCSSRNTGAYTDWRAPNIVELGTLIDYTNSIAPCLSTMAFPGAPASNFWSASPDIGHGGYSWYVQSSSNQPASDWQFDSTSSAVRCVRSSYTGPLGSRYTVGSGTTAGTVTDKVTGLVWQKVAPTTTYTQADAMTYCNSLSLGGSGAGRWRLPTIRELQTLVDYSQSFGMLMMDSNAFSGEPASYFWSSSPLAGYPAYVWHLSFAYGDVFYYNAGASTCVRCVL